MAKTDTDKEFKASMVKVICHVEVSSTQAIRVGIIDTDPDDPTSDIRIGVQKYWRKSESDDWHTGKGFHLDWDTANEVKEGLEKSIDIVDLLPEKKPSQGWLKEIEKVAKSLN